MTNITLLGIDIAKNVFQLHGVDKTGRAILQKKIYRHELTSFIAQLPVCIIAMEACRGAHYWARRFQLLGHQVKLISPQYVKPFVKTNKNDMRDAQAITEAASRPQMHFVSIKQVMQQDIQSLHRIRQRTIVNRTALANQVRGLLSEYGIIVNQGIAQLRMRLPLILEDASNELTAIMRELCTELYEELLLLDKKVSAYDKRIENIVNHYTPCQELMKIEGIGPLSATALLILLSDHGVYKNGRHFAAFLGLVPRQHSTGGKQRLLGISKRGDKYLRMLLIHGARSVMQQVGKKTDGKSRWLKELKERRGYNKASVALANKNARIAWALVANGSQYQKEA